MAFLTVNGLDISVLVDQHGSQSQDVEYFTRAQDDSFQGRTYARKNTYSLVTEPMTSERAQALTEWLQGDHTRWYFGTSQAYPSGVTFTFSRTDINGAYAWGSGASTDSAVGSIVGLSLELASNGTTSVTLPLADPDNWTFSMWQRSSTFAAGLFVVSVTNGSINSWYGTSATAMHSIATVHSFSFVQDGTSIGLTMRGRNGLTTTNQIVRFRAVSYMPLGANLAMAQAILNQDGQMFLDPPFVEASGDLFRKRPTLNRPVKVFVRQEEVEPLALDGGFEYDSRRLMLDIVER